jgi:rod shape determining protein RodA
MLKRIWQQLAIASNWPVLVAVAVLCALGTLSIWIEPRADERKHLLFLGVGVGAMALFQAVNYRGIARWAWPFYIFSFLLVLYTALPGVPHSGFGGVPIINGARRWISFGPMSLQPSELMKIAFVILLAKYLRYRSNYRTVVGLLPPFALAMVPLAVILRQPDLGTSLVFVPVLFAMLYVAGAKLAHLAAVVGTGVVLLPVVWLAGTDVPGFSYLPELVRPYQRARVEAMFSKDPATLRATGYQQQQALIALGSGQMSGKGLGEIPVGRFVPEAHNDMVFVLIGEQFGFIGSAVVLAAYIVLFAAGLEIAANTREPFGRLVVVGVVVMLAGQTFMNLMVVMRMMPATGLTLPFVSYGGSSLLPSFMAVGLLLNIGQNRPLVIARESFEY